MAKQEKMHELVYGIHPVIELLKAKRRTIVAVYTTKPTPKMWDSIASLLPKGIQVQYVSRDVLTRMADTTDHQSVIAYVNPFPYRKKMFDPAKQPFLVMLDGVQDPRNLGAIIRSAYCTGVSGVIMCKKSSAPLTATAIKASAGLAEHTDIFEAPSAAAAVIELKKAGYKIYAAALGGKDAMSVEYATPLCVVIGSEGKGVSSEVSSGGERIMLPQRRADISYNASVAAGILFFIIGSKTQTIKPS